jgi:hypothetical protein
VLAVIDFPPLLSWLWPWAPAGVPGNRGGHGVDARLVTQEVVASGFELVQVIEDWPGRWPLASYCAVFTKRRGRTLGLRRDVAKTAPKLSATMAANRGITHPSLSP